MKATYKRYDQFPGLSFFDAEQGTPEWFAARFELVGSSEAKSAFAGGQGKTRTALMERKIREQHTGEPESHIETFDMRWGTETEPEARQYFVDSTGLEVVQTGLVKNDKYPGFHTSPDGLIIWNGQLYWLEIKCPKFSTHLKYADAMVKGKGWTHPTEYKKQCLHHSVIIGAAGGFFVSYFPEQKAKEILGEDHPWAQIITFVPPPSEDDVHGHIEGMRKWNEDYKKLLLQAERLVKQYEQAELAKKNRQVAAISLAATRTQELIRRIS